MKKAEEFWKTVFKTKIDTKAIKGILAIELNRKRKEIEKKLGYELDNPILPKHFKRLNKIKLSDYGGTPRGDETDVWSRDFDYSSPKHQTVPFYIEVLTDSTDSRVKEIKYWNKRE